MRLTTTRTSERGVAMLLALMTLLLVAGLATLMFARTLNEMRHSSDDTAIVQTLTLARGGANMGAAPLGSDVSREFREIVERTATPGRWAYGNDVTGPGGFSDDGPIPSTVVSQMAGATALLQTEVDQLVCAQNVMPAEGMGEVGLRIYFTGSACRVPLPATVSLPDPRFVKGPPRSGAHGIQEYAIPFVLVSEANLNDYRRNIVMQGEYRFEVGQASFARYAYFTNRDSTTSGQIWFTGDTMIDGPTHTNGNFAFYQDPWFGGRVTSVGCTSFGAKNTTCTSTPRPGAFFYDRKSTLRTPSAMDPNRNNPSFGSNAPRLDDGVDWQAQFVALPDNSFDQESVALGVAGTEQRLDVGLHFNRDLHSLTLWAANGNGQSPNRNANGTWNPAATHQFMQACDWGVVGEEEVYIPGTWPWSSGRWETRDVYGEICETWRYNADGHLDRLHPDSDLNDHSTWVWQRDDRPFNGVIYTKGNVNRFRGPERSNATDGLSAPPALASFAEVTVVAEKDIRLTRDLQYEQPPCDNIPVRNSNRTVTPANCTNLKHANVLGVYTSGGDIIVGNDHRSNTGSGPDWENLNAPADMRVHAVLMSAQEQVRVEGHKERGSYRSDQGLFYLMGGMIQENRGVFGTFGSGRRGYDRVYTYDPRMRDGVAPPYFPTTGLDTVTAVRYFSFGQREQVY